HRPQAYTAIALDNLRQIRRPVACHHLHLRQPMACARVGRRVPRVTPARRLRDNGEVNFVLPPEPPGRAGRWRKWAAARMSKPGAVHEVLPEARAGAAQNVIEKCAV